MRKPIGLAIAGALAVSGVAFVSPPTTASAGPGDGTLTVRLIRDVNGNGSYEPALELGVQGIPVTVTDPAGGTATGSTGTDGTVTVNLGSVTGGSYRVEATIPPSMSYLKPAPAGNGLSSLTEFVNVAGNTNASVTMGVWNPADYCQANPTLITACQRNGSKPGANPSARALISFPFTARGKTAATQLTNQGTTGTVFGLAYRKQDKRIFAGSFAKRLAAYGPGGQGAIYVAPAAGGAATTFATVPNAGTTAHAMGTNADGPFYSIPGKQALGDLDLSEDGSELYVVNLNDKKLYVYDATGPTAAAPKASYDTPTGACANAADWRPGALAVRDGVVYLGGVCSAQTSGSAADLKAVVYPFTGGSFGAAAVNKALNFPRGATSPLVPNSNVWYPWNDNWSTTLTGNRDCPNCKARPMPLLSDIGIEANGDLVLDFRDRFGDMSGFEMPAPDGSGSWEGFSGGDLNRACKAANGTYNWEGTTGCANNRTNANSGNEPANVVEYYPGEYWGGTAEFDPHLETSQGAVAMVYSAPRMPAIIMDPLTITTGGVGWFDRTNGTMENSQHSNSYEIANQTTEGWGKANGLADLEALCDLAPVQIGNRAWFDTDADGVQDGNEPAVAGVKVTATPCDGGAALPVKTTSAKGEYYFGTADGVKADTCYSLKFDYSGVNAANLPGAPTAASLKWTAKEAGDSRTADSNVDTAGVATVTIGAAGSVDHTIDAGITAPPKVPVPSGCTGGIVTNPSVEQVSGSTPTGYTKVGPGTLSTEPPYAIDGQLYAWLSSPQNQVTTAYQDVLPATAGGVYDLAWWGGTHNPSFNHVTGLRFLDAAGNVIEEKSTQVDHDVDVDGKLQRYDQDLMVAPAGTAKVRFFVTANGDYNKFDCVYLRVAAYDVLKEVQDPASGQWLDADADPGTPGTNDNKAAKLADGATAKYRVTVTNIGTQPLSNITPADPWCTSPLTGPVAIPFGLAKGEKQVFTCDHTPVTVADNGHVNTVTVSKVTYPQGAVPDKTEKAKIEVVSINKVGDFVWVDANRNGLQDAGEPGVPGITAILKKADDTEVARKPTDAGGKYLFDGLADGEYKVCFDLAALPAQYAGYLPTKPNAGDDGLDSDADASGCTATTKLGADKREDLTLDAGIRPPNKLGDFVWIDTNRNGLQDSGEPGVPGVKVTVKKDGTPVGTATTDENGKYVVDKLPDGAYTVCFDTAALPAAVADYQLTKSNVDPDTSDSDADPATGCTEPVTLGVDTPENLTVDAGLVSPVNRLGDFVWVDTNKNGLQDTGEPGVPGVSVVVKKSDGTQVGTATTDDAGNYLVEGLPDGSYQVCFATSALPAAYADYVLTQANVAGGDDAKDSDADPATGCTPLVELGPGKRENLTLDAGLVSPPNKLGDFVWVDTNKNGLQDDIEPGVPGVSVVVKNSDGVEVGTTTTDDNGKYLFDKLPDGSFTVCFGLSALPAAYADYQVAQTNAGEDTKDSDADPATGCAPPVDLGPGKRENLTVDAGIVSPTNRLGDFVWVDTNKNGLQDDGEPGVAGVTVTAKKADGSDAGTATTDANGKYLIDNLPDGSYTVCFGTSALPAAYADYVLTQANVAGGDDAKDSDADAATGCTEPVELGIGKRENLTLDAGLVSPPNKLGDFVWVDTNKNGLQDDGEPGVPGVPVIVKDDKGNQVGTATTDANGKYLFDKLPDGTFTVCFGLTSLPTAYADYQVTQANVAGDEGKDSDADPSTGCAPPVELGSGKRENLTVDAGIVSPTNRLGDYVWVDTNKNGLQDDVEPGVAGVTVTAKKADGSDAGTATTDANGKYLIDNLPDGSYTVCFGTSALPATYADYQVTQANVAGGDDAKDSDADPATGCTPAVELGPGKRENLTVDAGIVSPVNRLGDYVWDDLNKNGLQDDGEPGVAGVTVTAKKADGSDAGTATTDANGKYLIDNLPDGSYSVCFGVKALPTAYADYQVTQANIPDGSDALDSDADPTTGCTEPVELGIGKRENLTLDAGIVSPMNKLGDFVWVDLNKNGLQDDGEPGVPGVPVVVKDDKGNQVGGTTTDENGKYLFDKLPDGTFTVCFGLTSLPTAFADYQVTQANAGDDGKDSDADPATGCAEPVQLGAGKRENLTVDAGIVSPTNRLGDYVWVDTNKNGLQDDGEPAVAGVAVTAKKADGSDAGTATTDANGKYLIDNLPDGTYTVCFGLKNLPAAYSDYQVTQANVTGGDDAKDSDADPATGCTQSTTLGTGKREDLTLDAGLVSPPNKLGDFVWVDLNKNGLQDDGEPGVAGVSVIVKDDKGNQVGTATTDAGGKYLVDNLPDGTFTVCFGTSALPSAYADYQVTKSNAGEDTMDSDADPSSGCTEPVNLGPGNRENQTVDAGIVSPVNRVGDYVWIDSNGNGLQDSGEPGVEGVTAVLRSGDTEVARTTTDAGGKYLFDNLPDGSYRVCFDVAKLPAAVADYTMTQANAGADGLDSDADTTGCTEPVTLGTGNRENLTLDAGLVAPPNRLGDYVWVDANRNGVQDVDESGVEGLTVILRSGDTEVARTTSDGGGKYLFDKLPDGTYHVCFDRSTIPADYAGYLLTKPKAGEVGADSDADLTNGCTEPVTLGVGKRENFTLDAGIRPPNKLGDLVWVDTNRNGLQDQGEPGVSGVTVTLKAPDGTVIGTTKTDKDGKYGFGKLPDGSYVVCFDRATLPAKYADYQLAKPNAGDDAVDSDADPGTWCTPPVVLSADHPEDLSVDAGIVAPRNRIGDYVWIDKNGNGLQDPGELAAPGVPVILRDAAGKDIATVNTDPAGKYLFDDLPDGTYQVCFRGTLPAALNGYSLTKPKAGDDAVDSDADQTTGCTRQVTVGPEQRENLLLDAGLVAPPAPAPAVTPPPPSHGLSSTGQNLIWMITLGLLTLGIGSLLVLAGRRRRTRDS